MNRPIQPTLEDLREIQTFAALHLDGQQWLVPQSETQALEPLLSIDSEVQLPGSIGAIALAGEWWPTYCLSGELRLLSHPPPTRRVCVLLSNDVDRFGLICDQVEALADLRLFALPICMTLPDSPIQALALRQHGLSYVTTTEQLAAWIAALVEKINA